MGTNYAMETRLVKSPRYSLETERFSKIDITNSMRSVSNHGDKEYVRDVVAREKIVFAVNIAFNFSNAV